MVSADLILFTINSALRLNAAARAHYVASTQVRELTFPIPSVDFTPDALSAVAWFRQEGKAYISESKTLMSLEPELSGERPSIAIVRDLDEKSSLALLANYEVYFKIEQAKSGVALGDEVDIDNAALIPLLHIQQWQRGESPHPSLLKRVAGNLIDAAVDYFIQIPGALNKNSKHAKAIRALVEGLDKIEFTQALTPENIGNLPEQLLVATLETVSEKATDVVSDPRYQKLIMIAAQSLSEDIRSYFESITDAQGDVPIDQRQRASHWAELVFRSILGSAGKAVFENPEFFLKQTDEPQKALSSQVGSAVLSAILSSPQGQLDEVFNNDTLASVIKSSLSVVSQHPTLLVNEDQRALSAIIQQVSEELADFSKPLGTDFIPFALDLILSKTANNVELFWLDEQGQPKSNSLVKVVKTVVAVLQNVPDDANWRVTITRTNIDLLLSWTLQQVVENPAWLLDKAGEVNPNLELALNAMMSSIRTLDDVRLSSANAAEIVQVGLKAVMLNQDFVKARPDNQQLAISAIFDVFLNAFFGKQVNEQQRQFLQFHVVSLFMDKFLQELARHDATLVNLLVLTEQVKAMLTQFRNLDEQTIELLIIRMFGLIFAEQEPA